MTAAERVADLYRRHAGAWAAARGGEFRELAWIDRFAALLGPGAMVLDIGCGPGEPIAVCLARRGHPVTGVDSSPEMIALFQASLPNAAAGVADMRSLSLGSRFGGLVAWDSLFHLVPGEQRLVFAVFRDHALPGAPLLFTGGPAFGEATGTLGGEPLYHASLAPGEYRRLLRRNDFDVVAHAAEDPGCGGHTVWLARRRPRA
jgi:SAM-dependent methyltransferase